MLCVGGHGRGCGSGVSVFVWIESCICVNTCILCIIVFVCESVFRLHLVDWVLYGRALSLFIGGRERRSIAMGSRWLGAS